MSCQKRIDADIDTVRRTAAEVFNTPFSASGESAVFALSQDPYWVTKEKGASLIPDLAQWLDHFLPKSIRAKRLRARTIGRIDELVLRNAENLRWALLRGIDETFREATATLQARIDEAESATRGVIEEALIRRRDASYAIDSDLERLNRANEVLSMLRRQLSGKNSQPYIMGDSELMPDCPQS